MSEHVVLVNDENAVQGTLPKLAAHTDETPLHRGFSVYVFKGDHVLLQQRSPAKKTWPGFWSNSYCGHPQLEEDILSAAKRRAEEELRLEVKDLSVILPEYRYTAENNGVVENELCPVLVAEAVNKPRPVKSEVEKCGWVTWEEALQAKDESVYSPWFLEEKDLLEENDLFQAWLEDHA